MSINVYVTQKELEEIAEHDREISWRTKRAEELKSSVRILLHGGATVEPGRYDVRLEKRFGRSIPWKQCVIERLGMAFAEVFRKQYPVHVFFEVKVIEHAVPPLWRGIDGSIENGSS